MSHKELPLGRFSDLGIAKNLLDILTKNGFETPTPIQHQIIPGALEGKDVVGIAQTGTGKTLAFGIPMIQQIAVNKGQGLVLVPTRELALQVEEALNQIGSPLGLRTTVIIGGVSQKPQERALAKKPHVVIATPGRLDDLIQQRKFSMSNVTVVALDEADRMLDVGFLPQIKRFLKSAKNIQQTMLFSATMPKSISKLATEFMKLPLRIEIAPQGTSAKNIEQEIFVVNKKDKIRLLDSLLESYVDTTVLVFSRTKHGAKRIARDVRNMGHTATEIHGNRSQAQRQKALKGFTNGEFRVMVATDIAARGIDVEKISLVINFDLPDNIEDYVHRIGRTGRAGRSGRAISFVTHSEKADVRRIEKLIRKSLKVISLPKLPESRPKPPREPRPSGISRSSRKRGRTSGDWRGKRSRDKDSNRGGRDSRRGDSRDGNRNSGSRKGRRPSRPRKAGGRRGGR